VNDELSEQNVAAPVSAEALRQELDALYESFDGLCSDDFCSSAYDAA
jgi:hypothetical protein